MEIGEVWAKRGGREGAHGPFHPLLCHLVDVAEVARQLLLDVVSPAEIRWLSDGLGIDETSAQRWLVIASGFHDLGKACGGFQDQIPGNSKDVPHGSVSTAILRAMLAKPPLTIDTQIARRFATIIGGHHGAIPSNSHVNSVDLKLKDVRWRKLWPDLINQFLELYPLPEARPAALDNARAMWLAGFISAADWVGSNIAYFNYAASDGALAQDFDLTHYRNSVAIPTASTALRDLGWLAVPATIEHRSFTELFPNITTPNDLQVQAIRVATNMKGPGLVIVEAPMGEGKSEAALYLADQASVRWGLRGAYLALPTMATSNQMFDRVRDFLSHRYDSQFVQIQLLHGHASLSEDVDALRANFEAYLSFSDKIRSVDGEGETAELASAVASGWFTGRKQGILSPFGVGTIDQALLAVLPIKHFFVRLFGLSNKTIILDEIHAYDTYMTTLLERLLAWLAAMNCHVILLSATLPAGKRARLLAAYGNHASGVEQTLPLGVEGTADQIYPRISWMSGSTWGSNAVTVSDLGRKNIAIRWLDLEPAGSDTALANELARALAKGGCAAVICNTVRRAQSVFTALLESGLFSRDELDLLHARFLFKDRRMREECALKRFGKPNRDGTNTNERPLRMILVATQVIEQSLDLDFDLMVSDLAPVDLLLQRAGRLHRHARRNRPAGLETPGLWIVAPETLQGVPCFDRGAEYVYASHVLLRTWLELRSRTLIQVSEDISPLIEAVYGDREPPADLPSDLLQSWSESAEKMECEEQADSAFAQQWQIKWPRTSGELHEIISTVLDDEDADAHPAVRAQTRLSDPSVTVVCHFGPFRQASFEPDGAVWNLAEPNRELVRICLENSVSISRRDVVNDLTKRSPPAPWQKNGMLRSMRSIQLDQEGGDDHQTWRLGIDKDIGIVIESVKGG